MILETKYNIDDMVWFISYRKKHIIEVPITAIEINVRQKTSIRYQINSEGKYSYFFEFQLFNTELEAMEGLSKP